MDQWFMTTPLWKLHVLDKSSNFNVTEKLQWDLKGAVHEQMN